MVVWISLIGGIILGWLIEWLVDWLYWRRGIEAYYRTELELRRELEKAQNASQAAQAEAAALRAQLIELGATPNSTDEIASRAQQTVASEPEVS